MTGIAQMRGIGDLIDAEFGGFEPQITAGAGHDGAEQTYGAVDRLKAGRQAPLSCAVIVFWSATLQQAETLSLAFHTQDDSAAAFNATPATLGTVANAVVATGPTGGGTVIGMTKLSLDLSSARRYLRTLVTANLSASGTDTVRLAIGYIFGGQSERPV